MRYVLQEFVQNIATQLFSVVIQSATTQKRFLAVSGETTKPVCISLSGAWSRNYHYYLNVDRCAYEGLLKLSASGKGLCGPYIFAVNHNCTAVYYHQGSPPSGLETVSISQTLPRITKASDM